MLSALVVVTLLGWPAAGAATTAPSAPPEVDDECRYALDLLVDHWPDVTQDGFDTFLAAVQEIDARYDPEIERVRDLLLRLGEAEDARDAAQAGLTSAAAALEDATAARLQAEEALAAAIESGDPEAVTAAEEAGTEAEDAEDAALGRRDEATATLSAASAEVVAVLDEIDFEPDLEIGRLSEVVASEYGAVSVVGLPPQGPFEGSLLAQAATGIAGSCPTTDLAALGVLAEDGSGDGSGDGSEDGSDEGGSGPDDADPAVAPVATPVPARARFTG